MIARALIRGLLVIAALAGIGNLGGCYASTLIASPALPTAGIFFAPLATPAGAIPAAYASVMTKHGPHATFENTSDTRLSVRYWVGKPDFRAVGGIADWRSPVTFEIDPGEKKRVQLGRKGWFTANSDAIVRVQVSAVVPPDTAPDQVVLLENGPFWYEFERPAPYFMKATGQREALAFESYGQGGIKPVDRSEWFDRANDDFPARNVAQLGAVWDNYPG